MFFGTTDSCLDINRHSCEKQLDSYDYCYIVGLTVCIFYSDHNSVLPLLHGLNTVTSLFAFALLLDMQQGISTISSGTATMTADTNTKVNFLL